MMMWNAWSRQFGVSTIGGLDLCSSHEPAERSETRKHVGPTAPSPEDRHAIEQVLIRSRNATVFHTLEWNNLLINEFDG